MAKNLVIYGLDSVEFTTGLQGKLIAWKVPQQEQLELEGKLSQKLSAEGLGFLWSHLGKQNLDLEGIKQELGLREIIYFQSRDTCFAMRQLLCYYNAGYSWDSDTERFPSYEGDFVLSRTEIAQILDWFITISTRLGEEEIPLEPLSVNMEMQAEAEKLIRTGYGKREEFEYFSEYRSLFSQWKNKLALSGLKEFYWFNF